jgi:hypothetical protein
VGLAPGGGRSERVGIDREAIRRRLESAEGHGKGKEMGATVRNQEVVRVEFHPASEGGGMQCLVG